MEETKTGEEKRQIILNFVNGVRKYVTNAKADEKYIEKLDLIQQRIEGANVLETYINDFGLKEYREAEAIFQTIHAKVKQDFRKRDIRIKRRFQASVIPIGIGLFFIYYGVLQKAKVVQADITHEVACISLGIFIASVFYILDTLTIYFISKQTSSHAEWSFVKQVFIVLTAGTLIILSFYVVILFYSVNLYLSLSPSLTTIVQGAINLNIGALFAFASIALGDLAALFGVWEFIQKKLRKLKNDILQEEHEGVNE